MHSGNPFGYGLGRIAPTVYGNSDQNRDRMYDNPRFTIGSDTRELIIPLGRTFETGFSTTTLAIDLIVKRRSCTVEAAEFTWSAYAVKEGRAHFEIPDELVIDTDAFPRGMYDVTVMLGGCSIASLEMIKAPSYFVRGLEVRDSKDACPTDSSWVEPPCVEPESETTTHIQCNCPVDPDSGCFSCVTEYHTAEVTLKEGYGL